MSSVSTPVIKFILNECVRKRELKGEIERGEGVRERGERGRERNTADYPRLSIYPIYYYNEQMSLCQSKQNIVISEFVISSTDTICTEEQVCG